MAGTAIYVFQIEIELATELPLLGSRAGLVLAHIMITIPWTVRLLTASLSGFDRSIEEAALNLGATPLQAFLKVTLPVIKPGVVAAALFGFIISFGNLEMTLFLVAPGQTTLAHRHSSVSAMAHRSDHRRGVAAADRADRRGHAGHRPLRQADTGAVRRPMARLQLTGLTKTYGDFRAVADVNLDIGQGELVVLLGPSGCGKTTTLRMIAGFIAPTAGEIRLGGNDITRQPPWKRNTGLVFQSYALFPHLSVADNVAFGLRMRKLPQRRDRREAHGGPAPRATRERLADRLPRELSGGQQQRVALARALVIEPDILLLDEPLSNLDAKLRHEVRVEIRELQKKLGLTTVMVTHDQEEALTMADRLVVMSNGQVQQVGSQRDLYENPANTFVAGFVGRTNFLHGRVETPGVFRSESGLGIRCDQGAAADGRMLALRPERLSLAAARVADADNCFPGTVEFASYLGGILEYYVRLTPQDRLMVQAPNKFGRSRARRR